MATHGQVTAAAKQHEWPRRKSQGIGRIIGPLNRKAQPQQAGDDRLHQPFGQTAAAQAGGQAEQIGTMAAGVGQGQPQGPRLQPHIGIEEEQPIAPPGLIQPAVGLVTGPVFPHPALPLGAGACREERRSHRTCRQGSLSQGSGLIGGTVVNHQEPPGGARGLAGQDRGDAIADVGRLVVGRYDHRE